MSARAGIDSRPWLFFGGRVLISGNTLELVTRYREVESEYNHRTQMLLGRVPDPVVCLHQCPAALQPEK